jgi:hypothetical protein
MAKVRFSMKNQTQKGRFSKEFKAKKGRFSKNKDWPIRHMAGF